MPTDNPRAEAIEEAKRELRPYFDVAYRDRLAPAAATRAVDAAIPHLLAPIRALLNEPYRCPVHGIPDCSPLLNGCSIPNHVARDRMRLRDALDAIEASATSEGGRDA